MACSSNTPTAASDAKGHEYQSIRCLWDSLQADIDPSKVGLEPKQSTAELIHDTRVLVYTQVIQRFGNLCCEKGALKEVCELVFQKSLKAAEETLKENRRYKKDHAVSPASTISNDSVEETIVEECESTEIETEEYKSSCRTIRKTVETVLEEEFSIEYKPGENVKGSEFKASFKKTTHTTKCEEVVEENKECVKKRLVRQKATNDQETFNRKPADEMALRKIRRFGNCQLSNHPCPEAEYTNDLAVCRDFRKSAVPVTGVRSINNTRGSAWLIGSESEDEVTICVNKTSHNFNQSKDTTIWGATEDLTEVQDDAVTSHAMKQAYEDALKVYEWMNQDQSSVDVKHTNETTHCELAKSSKHTMDNPIGSLNRNDSIERLRSHKVELDQNQEDIVRCISPVLVKENNIRSSEPENHPCPVAESTNDFADECDFPFSPVSLAGVSYINDVRGSARFVESQYEDEVTLDVNTTSHNFNQSKDNTVLGAAEDLTEVGDTECSDPKLDSICLTDRSVLSGALHLFKKLSRKEETAQHIWKLDSALLKTMFDLLDSEDVDVKLAVCTFLNKTYEEQKQIEGLSDRSNSIQWGYWSTQILNINENGRLVELTSSPHVALASESLRVACNFIITGHLLEKFEAQIICNSINLYTNSPTFESACIIAKILGHLTQKTYWKNEIFTCSRHSNCLNDTFRIIYKIFEEIYTTGRSCDDGVLDACICFVEFAKNGDFVAKMVEDDTVVKCLCRLLGHHNNEIVQVSLHVLDNYTRTCDTIFEHFRKSPFAYILVWTDLKNLTKILNSNIDDSQRRVINITTRIAKRNRNRMLLMDLLPHVIGQLKPGSPKKERDIGMLLYYIIKKPVPDYVLERLLKMHVLELLCDGRKLDHCNRSVARDLLIYKAMQLDSNFPFDDICMGSVDALETLALSHKTRTVRSMAVRVLDAYL